MTVVQIWVLLSVFFVCVMSFPLEDPYCVLATAICVDGEGDLSGHFDTLQEAIDSVVDDSGIKTIYVGKDLNSTEEGFKWCMDNLDNFPHYNCSEQWEGLSIKIGRMENQDAGTSEDPITITPHPDVDEIMMSCGEHRPGGLHLSDDTIVTIDGGDISAYMYFGTPYWKLSGNFRFSCENNIEAVFTIGPGIGGKTTIEGVYIDTISYFWDFGILIFENTTDATELLNYGEVSINEVVVDGGGGTSVHGVYIMMGDKRVGSNDNPEVYFASDDEYKIMITKSSFSGMDGYNIFVPDLDTTVFGLYVYQSNFTNHGLFLYGGTRVHFENNMCEGFGLRGHEYFDVEVVDNVISGETSVEFDDSEMPNSDTFIFRGNTMEYAYFHHVDLVFTDNVVEESSGYCLFIDQWMFHNQRLEIVGNTMRCSDSAIYMAGGNGVWEFLIEDNDITSTGATGIETGYCDQGYIKNNRIFSDNNAVNGNYCDLEIEGNHMVSVIADTIYVSYGSLKMTDNYVEHAGTDEALYLEYGDNDAWIHNNVFNCTVYSGNCNPPSVECVVIDNSHKAHFDSNFVYSTCQGLAIEGEDYEDFEEAYVTNNFIHAGGDYGMEWEYIAYITIEGNTITSDTYSCLYIYDDNKRSVIRNNTLICKGSYALDISYETSWVIMEDNFIQADGVIYGNDEVNSVEFRRNIVDCEYMNSYSIFYVYDTPVVIVEDNYFYNIDYDDYLFEIELDSGSEQYMGDGDSLYFQNNVFEVQALTDHLFYFTIYQYIFETDCVIANNLFIFNESNPLEDELVYFYNSEDEDSVVDNFHFVNNILIGDFSNLDSLFLLDSDDTFICENDCEVQFNYVSHEVNYTDITDEWVSLKNLHIANNFVIEDGSPFDFKYGGEDCFGMPEIPDCYRPASEVSGRRWNISLDHDLSLQERTRAGWVTVGPFEFVTNETMPEPEEPEEPEPMVNITTIKIVEEAGDAGTVAAIVLGILFIPLLLFICFVFGVVALVLITIYMHQRENKGEMTEGLIDNQNVEKVEEEIEMKDQKKGPEEKIVKTESGSFKRRSFLEFKKD